MCSQPYLNLPVSILGRPLAGATALQKFIGFTLTAESSDYNKLNPDVGLFKVKSDIIKTQLSMERVLSVFRLNFS